MFFRDLKTLLILIILFISLVIFPSTNLEELNVVYINDLREINDNLVFPSNGDFPIIKPLLEDHG